MTAVLMLSVGGSPQPLRRAIEAGAWARVHFVVSGAATGARSSRSMVEDDEIDYAPQGAPARPGPGLGHLAATPPGYGLTQVPPDDLDRALAAIDAALAAEIGAGRQVTVDYTGGTKTMTAAMVLAATAHEGVRLQFMSGRRPDLHRVEPGTEAAVAMPVELIGLARLFATARAFVGRRNYAAARDVITGADDALAGGRAARPPASWRKRIAAWGGWLATMAAWDRFDHAGALRSLQHGLDCGHLWAEGLAAGGFAARLEALAATAGNPDPVFLEDLWLNAGRRAALGQFDDAVARLYRLAEAAVQCRLWSRHGVRTGDVDPAVLREAGLPLPEVRETRDGRETSVLALTPALDLLRALDRSDAVAAFWLDNAGGRFLAPPWQGERNRSILAHGFRPLGEADWKKARDWFGARRRAFWEDALGRPTAPQLPDRLP